MAGNKEKTLFYLNLTLSKEPLPPRSFFLKKKGQGAGRGVNQIELAKYFNLNKATIGRYLKSGKLLLKKYSV